MMKKGNFLLAKCSGKVKVQGEGGEKGMNHLFLVYPIGSNTNCLLLWAIDIPIGILSRPLGELTDGIKAVVAEIAVTSDVTNDPISGSKAIINTFVL